MGGCVYVFYAKLVCMLLSCGAILEKPCNYEIVYLYIIYYDYIMTSFIIINLFHIFIIGGLFLYIGIQKNSMPSFMYPTLVMLGVFVCLYHIYKAYMNPKFAWVNYIHMFIVGPLLVYIGFTKEKTERKYYEIILMLAFAAIGYHGYYLILGE